MEKQDSGQTPSETERLMSQLQPRGTRGGHRAPKILLVVAALLVLVLVLLGGYSRITGLLSTPPQSQEVETVPGGHIFMSLATLPLNDRGRGAVISVSYDASSTDLQVIPLPDDPGVIQYQYRMVGTTTRPWLVFVRATGLKGSINDTSSIPFEVYRMYLRGLKWSAFYEKLRKGDAEKITNDPQTHKQFPEISRAGDVVYMARPISGAVSKDAESWSIHYVPPDGGEDKALTKGTYPKWVNDEQFIFLKNDGLYLYTIASQQEKKIWEVKGVATTDMTLYLSDDAQYIALAAPGVRAVFILRALRWDTGTLVLKGAVPIAGWYPVISPDNRFLAIQTRPVRSDGVKFSFIKYVDIKTLRIISSPEINLDGLYGVIRERVRVQAEASSTVDGRVSDWGTDSQSKPDYVILDDWLQTTHH